MTFTKKDVIQIDVTIIAGILVLLSLVSIVDPKSGSSESTLPSYFFDTIYLVTYVVAFFSVSAMIEIGIICFSWKTSSKSKTHDQIMTDFPDRASPAGLFVMFLGFAWLTGSIVLYSIVDFFKL